MRPALFEHRELLVAGGGEIDGLDPGRPIQNFRGEPGLGDVSAHASSPSSARAAATRT